jgi:hypothetical protein
MTRYSAIVLALAMPAASQQLRIARTAADKIEVRRQGAPAPLLVQNTTAVDATVAKRRTLDLVQSRPVIAGAANNRTA